MEAKHTPGPWTVKRVVGHLGPDSDGQESYPVVGPEYEGFSPAAGWRVPATVYQTHHKSVEADAVLIAATPELAEALRGCADALREAGKSFAIHNPNAARPNLFELHEQTARAALKKAGIA